MSTRRVAPMREVARTVVVADPLDVRVAVVEVDRALRSQLRRARPVFGRAPDRVAQVRRDLGRVRERVCDLAIEGGHVEISDAVRWLPQPRADALGACASWHLRWDVERVDSLGNAVRLDAEDGQVVPRDLFDSVSLAGSLSVLTARLTFSISSTSAIARAHWLPTVDP